MNTFKTSLKLAIMRSSGNVKSSGVAPFNLLVAYFISRSLPFNYHELNDTVAFNNAWESLMPTARELAKDMAKYVPFSEERVIHYTKRFFEYRANYSSNVWFNLFQVFGYEFFGGNMHDQEYDGVILSEQDKMDIIIGMSTAFEEHRGLLKSDGYISLDVVYSTFVKNREKYTVTNRSVEKLINKLAYRFMGTLIRMQMWSTGHNKRLTKDFRPFLNDMFNYVQLGCIVDDSLTDFILEHSASPVESGSEVAVAEKGAVANIITAYN